MSHVGLLTIAEKIADALFPEQHKGKSYLEKRRRFTEAALPLLGDAAEMLAERQKEILAEGAE